MANPTSVDDVPAVIVTSTGGDDITLNPDRRYHVAHDGETNAGAASAVTVYLSFSAAVDADESEGADKAKLIAGRSIPVPAGTRLLRTKLKAAAPSAPTITIVPTERQWGAW